MDRSLILNCARCFTPTRSAYRVEFTYEDIAYAIDLCERHVEMFDRDLTAWTRMAVEVNAQVAAPAPASERIVFPVSDGCVVVADDRVGPVRGEITEAAMTFTFTEHALYRMRVRHIDRQDVFRALSAPDRTSRESLTGKWPDAQVWIHGDIKLVVNPKQKRVISVMWRTEEIQLERRSNGGSGNVENSSNGKESAR